MAALDADVNRKGRKAWNLEADAAVQTFAGGLAAIRGPDHATAAHHGKYAPYDNAKGNVATSGLFLSGAEADEKDQVNLQAKLVELTVTGVTGVADVGKDVYATTDNDFTLTRPAIGEAVGTVRKHVSGTTALVLLWGDAALNAPPRGGNAELIFLGQLDFDTVADGDLRTGFPMPFHGEILDFFAMTKEVLVGSGGTIDVSLEIAAAAVTGGVLTMSTAEADTLGKRLDATDVTDNNVFHEGDALDVVGANAAGTRTSGILELYAKVARRQGA